MFPECKYFMSLYKQCFCHRKRRGYSGAEYERFVYMWPVCVCVCVCGPVARHMWQCQCVTAGPPGWGAAPGKVTQQSGFCMVM